MRLHVAALVWLSVAGCESPPRAVDDAAVPDLLAPAPDLGPPAQPFCHGIECLPPSCCGNACQNDGQCCPGTLCGAAGRCAPSACQTCGELGCIVDFVACKAACAKPPCCLQPCTNDGDCCPATRCRINTDGFLRCMPKACDSCVGLRPVCDVGASCDLTCLPPASCGKACNSDPDCGANNRCRQFLSGERECVPLVFDSICNACGLKGCLFHPDLCTIECAPTGGADLASSVADAASATDGASSLDALSSVDLAPRCTACCASCTGDQDCCGTQRCEPDAKGRKLCVPSECAQCSYGCRFFCP